MDPDTQSYSQPPKFHLALDCIIFGFDRGELKLLIHQRRFEPFTGHWSLFGGFLRADENLSDSAGRVVSVAYYALIPAHRYSATYSRRYGATWVNLHELPELIMDHNAMVEEGLRSLRRCASSQPIGFELLPKEFTIPKLQSLYKTIFQSGLDKRNFRKKKYNKLMNAGTGFTI